MSLAKLFRRAWVDSYDQFIDNALNKVNAVNKPFKAIQRTDEYKKFEAMFAESINEQAKWVSENLDKLLQSAGVDDDLSELTLDQQQRLRGLISRDMPALTSYITDFKVLTGLKDFFEWSAVQQYRRWGYVAKGDAMQFTLTNTQYINKLKDRSSYLLNQSSLDSTTLDDVVSTIIDGRSQAMTNAEVAGVLSDEYDEISSSRADMITRTESANAMGDANYATAKENGAETHSWIEAGDNTCDECASNSDQGEIPIDQEFDSGDLSEPAHPNCECYTEAGQIDLDSISLWDGE